MRRYKHIFFDFDRTIWDFDLNSAITLRDILIKFNLAEKSVDAAKFFKIYNQNSEYYWALYRSGRISKELLRKERFIKSLNEFGIDDHDLAEKIGTDYIHLVSLQTALIPNAKFILEYLAKNYSLYIITNGFMDVQLAKIKNSGLSGYFRKIFTSEHARSSKPNKGIFEFALKSMNAQKKESLMIGDDFEIDIKGAREFGIDQVYFNPSGIRHNDRFTYEIHSLLELKELL